VTVLEELAAVRRSSWWCDGDEACFGQVISDATRPVGQAENLMDDHDGSRLALHFGISDEAIYFPVAMLDFHPFAVARGFFESGLGPVLGGSGECRQRGDGDNKRHESEPAAEIVQRASLPPAMGAQIAQPEFVVGHVPRKSHPPRIDHPQPRRAHPAVVCREP